MRKIIVDSHCDSALKYFKAEGINSQSNQFKVNSALKYDKYIQVFAAYIEPNYITSGPFDLSLKLINSVKQKMNIYNDRMFGVVNKYELEKYLRLEEKKLGVMFSIEDAICLEGKIENLEKLYNEGVRIIGLTWNISNDVAGGANFDGEESSKEAKKYSDGLSDFGKRVIERMNELGIIVDVSHLSQKSFYDVVQQTYKPVIASHSNSMSVCNNKRNLTDEQIGIISKMGGMIGLNFYRPFVSENEAQANVEKLVQHIKHIEKIGGIDCIGIGADFDGMSRAVIGLEDNSKFDNLINELKKNKYSDDKIEKILGLNYIEFFRRNLK